MNLKINEDYYDNQKISDLLFDIENSGNERKIDKAYSYIDSWLDNPEDVYNDDYYDFRNASWGTSEESIIDYLTNILNESVNITKRNINEEETPNIEVKHKGILEVPEGKNVNDLPLSHFVDLANKKGLSKITRALNNLQVWNKNSNKKLSKWAEDMIDKLNKKLGKEESIVKLIIDESFGVNTFNVKDLENFITKELNKLPMAIGYVDISLEDDTVLIKIEVPWGDWKHEHRMLNYKLYDIISDYDAIHEFEGKLSGNFYKEDEEVTEEDGSDTYSSIHIYRIVLDEDYD